MQTRNNCTKYDVVLSVQLEPRDCFARANFRMVKALVTCQNVWWKMSIYSFSGETFAVFPKSKGLFYFVTVMFAPETECSKYEMEMIVHDRETEALDSELQVKFLGSPLSIDVAEEELNFFVKIIYTHFKHIIRDMLL